MTVHRKNHRAALAIILVALVALAIGIFRYAGGADGSTSRLGVAAHAAESIASLPDAPVPPLEAAPPAPADAPQGKPYIHIDKQTMTLTLYNADGTPRATFGVATGKGYGNKRTKGDMRTPEGTFRITQIQDASGWTHDFGDGLGVIEGAYGPWFMRLETPGFRGIGIHGTHKPSSIGTRDSEGCIRLSNQNVDSLRHMVDVGTTVIITPGQDDIQANRNN